MHATLSPSWKKSLLLVFVSVVAFVTATPATSRPQCFFQGLGILPGPITFSTAAGVNADGTVVVGEGLTIPSHGQAFRWTAETGMVGLDFLPGGTSSNANGVNASGKVVVGQALDASGANQAFRWTRATRMQSVVTLLLAAKVVTMDFGWQLTGANGVSADGTVIVGDGVAPLGLPQGWIARLPKESNEDCEEDDDNQGDNDNQGEDFGQ